MPFAVEEDEVRDPACQGFDPGLWLPADTGRVTELIEEPQWLGRRLGGNRNAGGHEHALLWM
jgi:hypothetical protein